MRQFFSILFEHIERFFFWGWKLRGNHDWDWTFLYEIIYLKLDRMYKCFKKYGCSLWMKNENSTEMRKIRITRELCKRLMNDDFRHTDIQTYYKMYFLSLLEKHIECWWD